MIGPALNGREHRRLADVLLKAEDDARPVEPFSETYPELRLADACRIRKAVLARRTASGEEFIGTKLKIGLVPTDRRQTLRVGFLTSGMLLAAGSFDLGSLIHPSVEAKLAFVLDSGTRGVRACGERLARSRRVHPCLEVVDSRYSESPPSFLDDVADSLGASKLLLGDEIDLRDVSLNHLRVRLDANPRNPGGDGASLIAPDVIGLLSNQSLERAALEAGGLVLSPPLALPCQLKERRWISACFAGLGALELEAR